MARKRKSGKRTTVVYKSPKGKTWAKSYRSSTTANKSVRALSKSGHTKRMAKPSKGFKYGRLVKKANSGKR